jgi:hypothetical protein
MLGFIHHQGRSSPNDQIEFATNAADGEPQTATITWLPSGVTFQLAGRVISTAVARSSDSPTHLSSQAETSIGRPAPTDGASGNFSIAGRTIDTPSCNAAMSVAPQKAACATGPPA